MTWRGEKRLAVIVTGASGGIGREIAKVAAREGGPVVLIARSVDALADAAEDVRSAGGEPFVLALDLTRPDASTEVERFLATQGLACSVLVNNAGYGLLGPAATLPRNDQLGIIDLNVRALVDLTLRFLPGMRAARRRRRQSQAESLVSCRDPTWRFITRARPSFARSRKRCLRRCAGPASLSPASPRDRSRRSSSRGRAQGGRGFSGSYLRSRRRWSPRTPGAVSGRAGAWSCLAL